MAFTITSTALAASQNQNIRPQILLEIDGITQVFSSTSVTEKLKIGDFLIGDGSKIGDLVAIDNQSSYISFQSGTTTQISQRLRPDKGLGESISTMTVAIVDKDQYLTKNIISPDETASPVVDILGRRCRIYLGFENTEYSKDFIIVFRGFISDVKIGAGLVRFQIDAAGTRQKGEVFIPAETELNGSITAGSTVLTVDDTSEFLDPTYTGASGVADTDITYAVRIDDEIITYEATTATQFQTLTRGSYGTTAAAHDDNASVQSFYIIEGNTIDIALKMMLSGLDGPYLEDYAATNFVRVSPSETRANTVFFEDVDLVKRYNIIVGDYFTSTGATNGSNNVSNKVISGIEVNDTGTIVTVTGVSFVEESLTSGVCDFRSQYDVWPSGGGLKNEDVDILEYQDLKTTFLSQNFDYRFFLREDPIELKQFISEQVLNPQGAFSLPRKSQVSVGFHLAGLIPGGQIKTFDSTNVLNPSKINIERSTSKNFYNAVDVLFDEAAINNNEFEKIKSTVNTDSRARIDTGRRSLIIESKGFRSDLNGANKISTMSTRRLNKYKFGAEFIRGLQVKFSDGFNLEVGDIVAIDLADLKITDIQNASRSGDIRLFQIENRSLDLKTGKVSFDLTDTNFGNNFRYGLISPASIISTATSTTQFVIQESYNSTLYGSNEYLKWVDLLGANVTVRSEDYATSDTANISSISGNSITLDSALSFTPSAGYIMELGPYDNQPNYIKLIYAFMNDAAFSDGEQQYQML